MRRPAPDTQSTGVVRDNAVSSLRRSAAGMTAVATLAVHVAAPCRTPPRDRASRCAGLPARAHARLVPSSRFALGGRRGRARHRADARRRARACGTRTRSRVDDGCRRPARSSPSRRTHARRSTAPPLTGWFTEDFTWAELATLRGAGAARRDPAGERDRSTGSYPRHPAPRPARAHRRRRRRAAARASASSREFKHADALRRRSGCRSTELFDGRARRRRAGGAATSGSSSSRSSRRCSTGSARAASGARACSSSRASGAPRDLVARGRPQAASRCTLRLLRDRGGPAPPRRPLRRRERRQGATRRAAAATGDGGRARDPFRGDRRAAAAGRRARRRRARARASASTRGPSAPRTASSSAEFRRGIVRARPTATGSASSPRSSARASTGSSSTTPTSASRRAPIAAAA